MPREIRQVRKDEIDGFEPLRDPPVLPMPTRELCYLYVWLDGVWVEVNPDAE